MGGERTVIPGRGRTTIMHIMVCITGYMFIIYGLLSRDMHIPRSNLSLCSTKGGGLTNTHNNRQYDGSRLGKSAFRDLDLQTPARGGMPGPHCWIISGFYLDEELMTHLFFSRSAGSAVLHIRYRLSFCGKSVRKAGA